MVNGMEWRLLTAAAAGVAGCSALGVVAFVILTPRSVPDAPPAAPLLIARSEPTTVPVEPSHPSFQTDTGALAPPPLSPQRNMSPSESEPSGVPRAIIPAPSRPAPPAPGLSVAPAALPPAAAPNIAPPAPPRAAAPKPRPPLDHRYDGVLTVAEINRIKASLRLSPDQEPYWPPVAAILRELGRQQMAQVQAGQKPDFNMSGEMTQRFYSAASPLLQSLREDQKEEVRKRARMMGLENFASFI